MTKMLLYSVRVDGGSGAWLHQAEPGGHRGVSERGGHDAAAEGDEDDDNDDAAADDDDDDQIEFLNELMSHPTIDGGHCSEPYLPTEPAELLQSGDYATEVDVLIGEGEGRDGATFVLILVLCSAP